MKYQTITAETLRDLENMVNVEISHNWEPTGGLVVYNTEDPATPTQVFTQAMISKSEQPLPPP